ncbi:TraB/GumN family protein [Pseudahrensia aquimaris]|uniref:TraB/GumN family protein n=1 Tax=Pseudahrensia aquimaris TaxID=744461 RepID=A0ABW3FDW2_9HYPH
MPPVKPRFWRRRSFAVLSVIALAISAALSGLMSAGKVSAADMVCNGTNVMDKLAKNSPEIAKKVEAAADTLPNGKGLLWKIEKQGARPSYLFGTMHMSDPRLLDLTPKVSAALNSSSIVALEVTDVLDPEKMKQKATAMLQYTSYTDGSDVTSRLSEADAKLVGDLVSKRGSIPWFLAKRLKPWALMGAIATPACENARKAAGKPFLDQKLAQIADEQGKELVSLETVESQIRALSSLPEPLMLTALTETAKLGDRMDDIFETMIQLYEREETGTVWAMMRHLSPEGVKSQVQTSDYAAFQREIVDKRNIIMAEGTEKLIKAGGGAFIAVGALHLPGENGLVSILAQRGYKVTRQ